MAVNRTGRMNTRRCLQDLLSEAKVSVHIDELTDIFIRCVRHLPFLRASSRFLGEMSSQSRRLPR
jgi:hypothetical protein